MPDAGFEQHLPCDGGSHPVSPAAKAKRRISCEYTLAWTWRNPYSGVIE